jgi:DNA-binding transcriptional ArsR family regulator
MTTAIATAHARAAQLFHALSDEIRLEVVELLRGGERCVCELTDALDIAQPRLSWHLKALKEAGLVDDRAEGTKRVYFIDPHGLGSLRRWLDQFWDEALAAFQMEVERGASEQKDTQR